MVAGTLGFDVVAELWRNDAGELVLYIEAVLDREVGDLQAEERSQAAELDHEAEAVGEMMRAVEVLATGLRTHAGTAAGDPRSF